MIMTSKWLLFIFLNIFYVSQTTLGTTLVCREGRYQCGSKGPCIPNEYVCDGSNDCSDGSDEDCSNGRLCKLKQCSHDCNLRDLLSLEAICSCPDGYSLASDEKTCEDIDECEKQPSLCSQNCTNTPGSFSCSCLDGFTQNTDGSCKSITIGKVEKPKLVCTQGKHPCDNGESCISEDFVCDGSTDCSDDSDEANCQVGRYCKLKNCEQTCTYDPVDQSYYFEQKSTREKVADAKCGCRTGFRLNKDRKTCKEIDECAIGTHNCTQICTNTIGSFVCTCAEGYYYDSRTFTCRATGIFPLMYISTSSLLTSGKQILVYNVKRHRKYSVPINVTGNIEKTVYDRYNKRIISLESFPIGGQIVITDELGQKRRNVSFEYEFANPVDFDYDWINHKVYVTDPGNGLIVACDLENGTCASVVENNLFRPTKIVLNSIERTMFWIDSGKFPGIYSSGMDGSNVTTIVEKDINQPKNIALDPSTKTLLWADKRDESSDIIEALHVPSMRRWKLYDPENNPQHMKRTSAINNVGIFEDVVYFSIDAVGIYSFPKMNITINPKLEIDLKTLKVLSFSIQHPLLSPYDKFNNTCKGANCTEMCLLSPENGHKCSHFIKSERLQTNAEPFEVKFSLRKEDTVGKLIDPTENAKEI